MANTPWFMTGSAPNVMANYSLMGGASPFQYSYGGLPSASGAASAGAKLGGGGMDFLSAGMQIIGGWLSQRDSRKENRMDRQIQREQMIANRAAQRESLRAGMQSDQDAYERTIMRNRAAIRPWAEKYTGPRFTTANPTAPIFNPLQDPNHMFNQLGQPLQGPSTMEHPWGGG